MSDSGLDNDMTKLEVGHEFTFVGPFKDLLAKNNSTQKVTESHYMIPIIRDSDGI